MTAVCRGKTYLLTAPIKDEWGPLERRILDNCLILKKAGNRVLLYCLKDSFLEKKARLIDIDCYDYPRSKSREILKWKIYFMFARELSQLKVDFVHCYDLASLWGLAFSLRKFPLTPLLVSLDGEATRSYRQLWYKTLLRRVDLFTLPAKELSTSYMTHFGITRRKIQAPVFGLNLDEEAKERSLSEAQNVNSNILGAFIGPSASDLDKLLPLLYGLKPLLMSNKGQKTQLFLYSDHPWPQNENHRTIRNIIHDQELAEHIGLRQIGDERAPLANIKLWIGLDIKEIVDDYALHLMGLGVPTLLPRTSFSMEYLGKNYFLGNTYKAGDARDLREKSSQVLKLTGEEKQRKGKAMADNIYKQFSYYDYKNQLFELYTKLSAKRARLYKKRLLRVR